jgi:type IV secretory pathway TrbF-like protein
MKIFLIGLIIGIGAVGSVSYFVYQGQKSQIATLNMQLDKSKQTSRAPNIPDQKDVTVLAAKLRNQQLEDLSKLQGEAFDRHYIMIVDTIANNRNTLALEAKKHGSNNEVKNVAENEYVETGAQLSQLIPLRDKLGLIH